jgi:glutathione S-transferase
MAWSVPKRKSGETTVPTPAPYRFHAFEVSYFSAKVRPALRYKRLWYEELRADLREVARRTGLGFIPIVVTPEDETWQDSTDIYDRLEARVPDPPLFPRTPVQRIAAHLVELYTDEFGTIPAMHYRWGSAYGEATARARFVAMIGDETLGNAAADRMAKARIALGATEAAAPAIEAHTRDLLDALSAHFRAHPYLLGARMSFADCALMGPLYGHFFNDMVSRQLLLETAVPVVGWIERSNYPTPEACGAGDPRRGPRVRGLGGRASGGHGRTAPRRGDLRDRAPGHADPALRRRLRALHGAADDRCLHVPRRGGAHAGRRSAAGLGLGADPHLPATPSPREARVRAGLRVESADHRRGVRRGLAVMA